MQSSKVTKWIGWSSYLLMAAFLSVLVLGSFFTVGINGNPPTMFRDMVDGTAHKPFVYRALVPAVIRTVENAAPAAIEEKLISLSETGSVAELFERYGWAHEDMLAYLIAAAFLYGSLLLFVHAFGVLAKSQYEMNPVFRRVLSLVALAGLPCFFRYYSYLYDFTHLILFCYALALMSRQRWAGYFPVFALACLSKETTVLLIALFCIHFWKDRRRSWFWSAAALQALIFVFVKVWLRVLFKENLGGSLEFHLGHNLTLQPYDFSQIGIFAGLILLCARHWAEKPVFLKHAVWMLLPLVGLTFLFGLLDEYRDYYEVYPVVLLLAVPAIAEFLRLRISVQQA